MSLDGIDEIEAVPQPHVNGAGGHVQLLAVGECKNHIKLRNEGSAVLVICLPGHDHAIPTAVQVHQFTSSFRFSAFSNFSFTLHLKVEINLIVIFHQKVTA